MKKNFYWESLEKWEMNRQKKLADEIRSLLTMEQSEEGVIEELVYQIAHIYDGKLMFYCQLDENLDRVKRNPILNLILSLYGI